MTYEYLCAACGHRWEAQQSISEDPLRECPSCHAMEAKRQISRGGGFILKGGGWYSDLYSSSGAGSSRKPETSPSTTTTTPSATSSEAKSSSDASSSTSGSTSATSD